MVAMIVSNLSKVVVRNIGNAEKKKRYPLMENFTSTCAWRLSGYPETTAGKGIPGNSGEY